MTTDVAARFRGFLTSCMLEIAPGVYTAPRMTRGVRDRVWSVLEEWFGELGGGSIVMTWRERGAPGNQAIRILGTPPKELYEADGIFLARRSVAHGT